MRFFVLISLGLVAGTAGAEETTTLMAPAMPERACYHAGLAYSEGALLTVDVPFRKESPQATQKRLMKCVADEGGEGLSWVLAQLD